MNSAAAPEFDGPIRETPTMAPRDDIEYRGREGSAPKGSPRSGSCWTAGIRHGPAIVHSARSGSAKPGEWVFVKRVLDRRPVVVLSRGGRGVDHPSAASNVAA
ncbi:MAG TPA: hypothetical protein VGP26_10655 [Actinophytocola sp.]|nr:hypothetical protein [Actinophytocola sp.]